MITHKIVSVTTLRGGLISCVDRPLTIGDEFETHLAGTVILRDSNHVYYLAVPV